MEHNTEPDGPTTTDTTTAGCTCKRTGTRHSLLGGGARCGRGRFKRCGGRYPSHECTNLPDPHETRFFDAPHAIAVFESGVNARFGWPPGGDTSCRGHGDIAARYGWGA